MDRVKEFLKAIALAVALIFVMQFASREEPAIASLLPHTQSLFAYNIDYGMDQARGDQTLEFYGDDETWGEKLRDIIDQTLRNNENHPESKDTAQNSYKRESALNNVLPEKRSSAFSKKDLSDLRTTKHPRDILK